MATYNAGESVGVYKLDTTQFEQSIKRAIDLYAQLGKAAQVKAPKAPTVGGGASPAAQASQQAALNAQIERRANLEARLAQVQNTGKQALQGLTEAEQIYSAALQKVAAGSDAAIRLQTQLQVVQNRIGKQAGGGLQVLPRTVEEFGGTALDQLKSGLLGVIGPAALVTAGLGAVTKAISGSQQAAQDALNLRETKNSLRAVAGDLQTYNQTLQAAREQQVLFGGTLQENIEGLSGLTITARSSGASLKALIDLSQRLAVLDPAQGANGARIALNEALSGDPTSLAKRYEIPRAALQKLRDTTLPVEDRLKVIDSFLNKVGITSESVAGKVDQDALAFRTLNAELEDARIKAGDQLATAFAGAATGLGRLVGIINQNPKAIAEIKALLEGRGGISAADIDQQAKNLRAGTAGDAEQQARDAAFARDRIGGTTVNTAALDEAHNRLIVLAASSDEMRDKVVQLYEAFGHTGNLQAFISGARTLETANQRGSKSLKDVADAYTRADDATRAIISSTKAAADQSALDAAAKELQQAATAKVGFETDKAASAFIRLNPNLDASQAFAAAAAQGLGPLVAEVIRLRVEADKTRAALLGEKLNSQTARQLIGADSDRAEIERGKHEGAVAGRAKGQAEAAAAAEALRQAQAAQGNVAPALEHAQAVLNQLTKDGKQGTAQYIQAQEEVRRLQKEQADKGRQSVEDQLAYADATNDTVTQRKILNDLLAKAKAAGDLGEQARILKQIDALNKEGERAAKSAISAAEKQVTLEERIRDARQAQLKATLDAQKSAAQDVLDRLKEQKELKQALNILKSPTARADFKQAAQARIDIINADQGLRQLDIEQKRATAGGTIHNGRILQSVQTGGVPVPAGPVPTAAGRAAQAQAQAAPPAGVGTPIQFLVDGKVVAEVIVPFVVADLHGGLRQAQSAGA